MYSRRLTVPATLDAVTEILNFTQAAAEAAGLSHEARYRLRLAVDELATNIVIHGYAQRPQAPAPTIEVRAEVDDAALTVTLEDAGIPFNPLQVPPPDDLHLPAEQRKLGGLGIYLATTGVDRFFYERVGDRNRNILVVNRPSKSTTEDAQNA